MTPVRLRYEPALDGVRAMAILLVVAAHSLPHGAGGGYGVNVFFTLSGFLITGLLLNELDRDGRVWMGGFYLRRAIRLLPALVAMLTLVALIPNVYVQPNDGTSMSRYKTIPAALFYIANMVGALGHPLGFLAHTWSLAIEEQYYLIWPAVLIWLAKTGRLRTWLPWLIIGAIASRLALEAFNVPDPAGWLPAQADQLLIGGLLAVWFVDGRLGPLRDSRFGWSALGVLAALALLGSASREGAAGNLAVYGGLTVAGIASAVLIGHLVIAETGSLRWLFTMRPAIWLGRVSYGVYLFHFPIFQWVQHERWPSLAKTLAVEYALAAVAVTTSWLLVERPALRLKKFARPSPPTPSDQGARRSRYATP